MWLYWRYNMEQDEYHLHGCMAYLKVFKTVNLKSSHHMGKKHFLAI